MSKRSEKLLSIGIGIFALIFTIPVWVVLMNSFKGKFFITTTPFKMPRGDEFVGFENYIAGIEKIGFLQSFMYSCIITIGSVLLIIICTSMISWYIARVQSGFTKVLYYLFVFSMIVPFQMVMFTMTKVANVLSLDSPLGLMIIYLGFGAGLSVFMFVGFIKSIPLEIEEAAFIDGCGPLQTFFTIVVPMLKPTLVTVGILNTMWIWNDYLLPYLVVGTEYKTIPIAIQYLKGGYGSIDMGAMMAMLVLAIIPIIIFYLSCQKHIIKGIASGAVKG